MKNFLNRFFLLPHFLYLLPFFFVFHGYAQNPAPVRFSDFVFLVGQYVLASGILFLIGWLFYREKSKAALFSFGLMSIHLFFGAFHDALKAVSAQFFLAKYSVLLPLLAMATLLFFFFLKKKSGRFAQLFRYLNLLFVLLIFIDVPLLFQQNKKQTSSLALQPCADCPKPDVYLIIADEYADSTSLAELFGFNNGSFQAALRARGFYIATSVSNYNFTPFSLASLFTMNYLPGLEGRNSSYQDRLLCASLINQNAVVKFFEESGYEIKNNAVFKVNNTPSAAQQSYFKIGTDFIASHTLLARIRRDLGYHLVTTLKLQTVIDDYLYYLRDTNQELLARHSATVRKSGQKPKFVYTHLHLPHYPYYFHRNGKPNPDVAEPGNEFDKTSYLEYLQYGNKIYLQMIDEIFQNAERPPVIILMGDHGFREFANPSPAEKQANFMNLNAVYLPAGNYAGFYKGVSGVNQFRIILNSTFNQNLPMLNDSTSYLQD